MHLANKLTWKKHIVKKRNQTDLKVKDLSWTVGGRSSHVPKEQIAIIQSNRPIYLGASELWGCASKSNVSIVQRSRSKILRMLTNAPWYVSNRTLHKDLKIPHVKDVVKKRSGDRMVGHPTTDDQTTDESKDCGGIDLLT